MRNLIQKIRDYRDRKFLERMNKAQAYKERNRELIDPLDSPGVYLSESGLYMVDSESLGAIRYSS